jgi:predicted alpha-1,6-mannanase (GH76 family)
MPTLQFSGRLLGVKHSVLLTLTWAKGCWTWFEETGMQGPNGLINDGVDLSTCKNNGYPTRTYNQGVILGGPQFKGIFHAISFLFVQFAS